MKIILDENVPWPLRRFLPGHDVTSVQREGLAGMENGALLACLDRNSDVFILCDKSLRYEQNLFNRVIAIIELPTNRRPVPMKLEAENARAVEVCSQGLRIWFSCKLQRTDRLEWILVPDEQAPAIPSAGPPQVSIGWRGIEWHSHSWSLQLPRNYK